ncbi:DUF6069 family protein [Actinomadura opuntiae]|uniref:DUF6069 family protein n=1 Tax=Actinomadura sp. OS1-43 TaxID=604315 RepID=UPI00255A8ECE|nr:DUF6069 family protein [Actinomadura sp. OS1-43]MDL4817230.1 DUF6069 family protein [Actinomadura sp. OS1-43]
MTHVSTGRRAGPRSPQRARALAVAGAVAAALERVTPLAARIWTPAALTLLAVSFLPIIGVEASGASKAVLALTHLAVAAVLIPVFRRTATTRAADTGSGR